MASSLWKVSSTSSCVEKVKLLWLMSDCRKVGMDGLRLCSQFSVLDQLVVVVSVLSGDSVLSNSELVLFLYKTCSLDKCAVSVFSVQKDLLHWRHIKMDAVDSVGSLSVCSSSVWCSRKCCRSRVVVASLFEPLLE